MKDSVRAIGELNIVKYDQFGNIVEDITVPNMVVTTGLNLIATKLHDASNATQIGWMEIGSDTTIPVLGNTVLTSPLTKVTTTSSSGNVSSIVVVNATGLVAGQTVSGTGIVSGTRIDASYVSGTTIPLTSATSTLSVNATITFNLSRVALTTTGGVITAGTSATIYTATYAAGVAIGAWTEAGLFTAASAGTMLSRTTFPVINKGLLDSITVSWTLTIS